MEIVFCIARSILFYWRGDTSFRSTFARLSELRSHFPDVPFLMLTATCTPQVSKHVTSKIHLPDLKQYTASTERYIYQFNFSNHLEYSVKIFCKKFPKQNVMLLNEFVSINQTIYNYIWISKYFCTIDRPKNLSLI